MSGKPKACIAVPVGGKLEEQIDAACEPTKIAFNAPREELFAALADVEGVLVTNRTRIDAEFLDAGPKLRIVAGVGVGYDNVDLPEATKRGVLITNTPDVVTEPVINLTIGFIVALSRKLFANEAYCRGGGWARRDRQPGLGFEIRGKTLGVVGFGRIGTGVTRRIEPFGMKPLFNDLFEEAPPGAPESTYRPLEDLLQESDIVTLHPDLNETSYHLVSTRELELMKPTGLLINTSRGPVVDQDALTAALQAETIAGAALDVLEREPPAEGEPILTLPNVLITPHIGTGTLETRLAMVDLAVQNLVAMMKGERPPTIVNTEVLD
jgi:glyoxylate reductase